MISITRISDLHAWTQTAAHWESMTGSVMGSLPWLHSWWNAYGSQPNSKRSLYVLQFSEEDKVVGFAPLCLLDSPLYGKQLEWIGGDRACSDNVAFLAMPGYEGLVAKGFANHLAKAGKKGDWDRIHWDGIQSSNPLMTLLRSEMEAVGLPILDRDGPRCWKVDISDGWDSYLQGLSKRARKILREQEKRHLQSSFATFVEPTNRQEVIEQLQIIESLHQQRWSERSIEGCFSEKSFSDFLHSSVLELFDRQQLFMTLLRIHDEPAAGAIGFWQTDSLCLYLVGMNPAFQAQRPGWSLNVYNIQKAIARGMKGIDFLRGDEPYKQRLGALPTEQGRWIATAPRVIPRLRHLAYKTGTWLKSNWKGHELKVLSPADDLQG